jgi:hypothetical protein
MARYRAFEIDNQDPNELRDYLQQIETMKGRITKLDRQWQEILSLHETAKRLRALST